MSWMMNEEPPDCEDLKPVVMKTLPEGIPLEEEEEKENRSRLHRRLLWFLCFAAAAAALLLFIRFVAQVVVIESDSMFPTLYNGDRVIAEKLTYRFRKPERFDIIVFRPWPEEKDTYYVKRVIGLPGETVWIQDGRIYIDKTPLEESREGAEIVFAGRAAKPVMLSQDEYFVLGDSRNNSMDSRMEEIGNIKADSIVGRAFFRIWPKNRRMLLRRR